MSAYTRFAPVARWALISAPLHLVWEILHARFYTMWHEDSVTTIVYGILHCTAGDVLIATVTFLIAVAATRRYDWPRQAWRIGTPVLLVAGIGYTVVSEWLNVYRWQSWTYTPEMPLIAGIGLTPLLQWLVVPLAVLWCYRRF